ncbi:single-stranded DNA-binding protein, mitochondrial-like [Melia azedarach]|uniref:Single-stranded DNA-binding protein, mitochondrial-like n=1 Tax=Melia azedarach TaxID=155640 RepID=A0ACC1XRI0_MELAZ|nr:single-stranded DNA-binding protein, mitochondrial-like [Melia azedarach]
MATLSRRLYCSLLSNPGGISQVAKPFCTTTFSSSSSSHDHNSDLDESAVNSDTDSSSTQSPSEQPPFYDRPLENGLDAGIYKAILVGQVGQKPVQKKLKSGRTVTLFSLGTGGIRNNRRPIDNEDPKEYASRCSIQWHRVSIYPERLGGTVMKHVVPGSILYLEGNLEQKIFNDPMTGLVRRIREVAIRRNGRLVFLGKGSDAQQPSLSQAKGVGYY